jgi:23S rRNA U2552 (ribose-2'-O)-methylase RlmE/FtsJ
MLAALTITAHVLRPGGTFVAKMFRGATVRKFTTQRSALLYLCILDTFLASKRVY